MTVFDKMTETEKDVGVFLKEIGIWWQFEKPVYLIDNNERPRLWTPDFYLPELGIHVEVCGSEVFDYDFRHTVYQKNDCPVIFVHYYKDEEKWKYFLLQRLQEISEQRKVRIDLAYNNALEKGYIQNRT